ncbi:unnamed protein product [Didymodactylos carnosus]|uniref:3CxxC-type domain-containing protein n=1 Tax=Didymodactylos carnosus TaxID=1234261 RepID=A0A8S2GSN4_9BILA|nr:unnamed protein product [Didymodactylos carnosus]CAF3556466.1 unnamed protein product [Didymodactylos carnosus]
MVRSTKTSINTVQADVGIRWDVDRQSPIKSTSSLCPQHHGSSFSSISEDKGFHDSTSHLSESESYTSDFLLGSTTSHSNLTSPTPSTNVEDIKFELPQEDQKLLTEEDYRLATQITDEEKKQFCSDMCLVFHAEFQATFGRYFDPDTWILLPISYDGSLKLPTECDCDVEIAKVRFECEQCGHCWTSMRGQVSFFYLFDKSTGQGLLYFKLFHQNCDQCYHTNDPLWYPEEVCRVLRNVFVIISKKYYPQLSVPEVQSNHYRRFGQPKGQHHGCESCRDGVCNADVNGKSPDDQSYEDCATDDEIRLMVSKAKKKK